MPDGTGRKRNYFAGIVRTIADCDFEAGGEGNIGATEYRSDATNAADMIGFVGIDVEIVRQNDSLSEQECDQQ